MTSPDENGGPLQKRILGQTPDRSVGGHPEWLDIGTRARVEVTSEDPDHPIEHALLPHHEAGWKASSPGLQLIRIRFDPPVTVHRLYLHFTEETVARTQEFALRWSEHPDAAPEELVRQQWNFSPSGSTHEIEDYRPSPRRVTLIELEIVPDVSGGDARASLHQLRLA